MIVRERPSGLRLFLVLRGSVLQRIRLTLLLNILLATLVTVMHGNLFSLKITLTAIPFTLIGLPLAIFLGFRNTTAYDRYWEARKLWGEIVHRTRTLSRQCQGLIDLPVPLDPARRDDDVRIRMVHRAIAFVHALRLQLRDQRDDTVLQRWLTAAEFEQTRSSLNPASTHGAAELFQINDAPARKGIDHQTAIIQRCHFQGLRRQTEDAVLIA